MEKNNKIAAPIGKFSLKGRYRIIKMKAKPWYIPVAMWLSMYRRGMIPQVEISRSPVIENLIVINSNHGLNLLMQHFSGNNTYNLNINKAAIGTGTTPAADADTALETPVVTGIERADVATSLDRVFLEFFITDDELPNGTYNEFAIYCNTQLFARSIIGGAYVKATNQDTLVQYEVVGDNT